MSGWGRGEDRSLKEKMATVGGKRGRNKEDSKGLQKGEVKEKGF